MVHNFAQIPAVPTAETLVEDVLRAGQKQAMDTEQLSMDEIRSFYMRKVSLAQQAFAEKMATIVESFPQMDTLHSFFADLFSVLYERDHFLLATAKLSDGGSSIARVASDYTKLLLFADSPDRCKEQARVSLGRMCTCIIQLNASLAYLEQARQHLSRMPAIDPNARNLLLCGSVNVGKSSFMDKVTAATAAQPYAFSSMSLVVGQCDHKYMRWQVINTPGILDRSLNDRSAMEKQAITALQHIQAAVLFFIDGSERCGSTIAQQVELFQSLAPLFLNKPILLVLNNLGSLDECSPEQQSLIQSVQGPNIAVASCLLLDDKEAEQLKGKACDMLTAKRMADKLNPAPSTRVSTLAAAEQRTNAVDEIEEEQITGEETEIVEAGQDEGEAGGKREEEREEREERGGAAVTLIAPAVTQLMEQLELEEAEAFGAKRRAMSAAEGRREETARDDAEKREDDDDDDDDGAGVAGGLLGLPWALIGQCWPATRVAVGVAVCQRLRRHLASHVSDVFLVRKTSDWQPTPDARDARSGADTHPSSLDDRAAVLAQHLRRFQRASVSLSWLDSSALPGFPTEIPDDKVMVPVLLRGVTGANVGRALQRLQVRGGASERVGELVELLGVCTALAWLDLGDGRLNAGAMEQLVRPMEKLTLEHVEMAGNRLGADGVAMLVRALKSSPGLRYLGLRETRAGADGVESVAQALPQWETLTDLDVTSNWADLDQVGSLANLGVCTALRRLAIGSNFSGDTGVQLLAAAIVRCSSLEEVNMSNCQMSCGQFCVMADAIPRCRRLASLRVDGNMVGSRTDSMVTGHRIARLVQQCTALAELHVELQNEGLTALGENLSLNYTLTHLSVSSKNFVTSEGVKALCTGLPQFPRLTRLDWTLGSRMVQGPNPGSFQSPDLAEAVVWLHNSLRHLNVEQSRLGSPGAVALAAGIWTCAALETINVSGNQIADDGMLALGGAMEGCVELTRLDLSKNVAGDRGGEELAGLLLKCCPRLEVLDVRDNRFSDAAAERMRGVLTARTRLVALIDRTDKGGARPVPSSWSSL